MWFYSSFIFLDFKTYFIYWKYHERTLVGLVNFNILEIEWSKRAIKKYLWLISQNKCIFASLISEFKYFLRYFQDWIFIFS